MNDKFNFIKVYQMDNESCDAIIEYYNDNKMLQREGTTVAGVIKERKESTDITFPRVDLKHMGEYGERLYGMVSDYIKTVMTFNEVTTMGDLEICERINIQHYKPGGGYKETHCERTDISNAQRELVFMTYLTDTPNAGTEFPQWDYVSECKKGKTLIWPASFTHMHHGVISDEDEKMIVTGWITWSIPESFKSTTKDGS